MYKKILLINPYGIGDVLFTTPLIHTLKDEYSAELGYLCNTRTATILSANPNINHIFIYERDEFEAARRQSFFVWLKKNFSFLNEIKKNGFELAIDFSLNSQYGFISWYSGIKKRIGYDFKGRGRFLTDKIPLSGYSVKHIVEYYADLLKLLNIDAKYKNLELYVSEKDRAKIQELFLKEGLEQNDFLVGIIPAAGRSWGKDAFIKHWPAQRFAALSDKIVENYKAKIIILGDFHEKDIADAVVKNMHYKSINLCAKTTLPELAAILSRLNLAITNDGGPLHMAVASGIKTVSVFGPVDEKVYGPYPPGPNHIVLKKDLSCRPCYQNFRFPGCSYNRRCIEDLTVDEAYEAVRRLI